MKKRSLPRRVSRLLGLGRRAGDVYALLDWKLTVRIGGILWLIGAAAPAAVLPYAPPTHVVGHAGWFISVTVMLIAVLAGVYLVIRPQTVSPTQLLLIGYTGATGLAIGQALIGPEAQFGLPFLLLAAYQATVHPARRVLPLLAWIVVVDVAATLVNGPAPVNVVQMATTVILIVVMTMIALMHAQSSGSLATQLIRLRDDAEHRAMTDSLTGLGNRRAFEDALARQVETAARYRQPLSLAMLDVDHFKAINDRFGHEAGDAALVAVATAIARKLRRPDVCFRWGGDEFAVLLPETPRESAEVVIQRVDETVRREGRLPSGQAISVGAGVSTLRVGERAGELLERADARLLAAKRGAAGEGDTPAAA